MKIEYTAKLKGVLDLSDDGVFIGKTDIRTILPDHFDKQTFEVIVKVYESND